LGIKGKIVVIGLLILVSLVILIYFFNFPFTFELGTKPSQEPMFNIQKAISNLNKGRSKYDMYSISEYDWSVWTRQFKAGGGVLIEMDNWEQFKESLRQNRFVYLLMLDQDNKKIWYRTSSTHVVFLNY